MSATRRYLRPVLTALAVSFGANVWFVVAAWLSTASFGTTEGLFLVSLLLFALLAALAAIPAALVGVLLTGHRAKSVTLLLCAASYCLVAIPLVRAAGPVRMSGFSRLAERSETLVQAIARYEKDHGGPPKSLQALVPGYLAAVPKTGMGAYPEYRYDPDPDPRFYGGNRWVLTIATPLGPLNWDKFIYFRNQRYPTRGFGGVLERVGKWAYVHE